MARPPFKPTSEQRKLVLNMAGIGCTTEEIQQCVPWGLPDDKTIDEKTIRAHFRQELDRGYALDAMRVRRSLHDLITAGNVAATIFYCKVRLGMKETQVVEATGKDGAPLPMAQLYLPAKTEIPPLLPARPGSLADAATAPNRPAQPAPAPTAATAPAEPRLPPRLAFAEPPLARVHGTARPTDRYLPADPRR